MKASEKRLEEFLGERNVEFVIPVYQRNYNWSSEQCKQFIDDIKLLAQKREQNIFLI